MANHVRARTADDLTVAELRELFDYNPATGDLIWRDRPDASFATYRGAQIWRANHLGKTAGAPNGAHIRVKVRGRCYYAHCIAWAIHYGEWPTTDIDHENQDGSANWIANLRPVDCMANSKNQPLRANSTGRMGVTWNRAQQKWIARANNAVERVYLGAFEAFEDACAARERAERAFGYHPNHGRERSQAVGAV